VALTVTALDAKRGAPVKRMAQTLAGQRVEPALVGNSGAPDMSVPQRQVAQLADPKTPGVADPKAPEATGGGA
jgi:hypothetical protein